MHSVPCFGALLPSTLHFVSWCDSLSTCTMYTTIMDFDYAQCNIMWCTSAMNYALCRLEWCTSMIHDEHWYGAITPCTSQILPRVGARPLRTRHLASWYSAPCYFPLSPFTITREPWYRAYPPCIVYRVLVRFFHQLCTLRLGAILFQHA